MKKRIQVEIYPNETESRWECAKYENPKYEYIDSDILVEIMKRTSKGSCLGPFPKIVVLPEGVFKQTGSGYCFINQCRDVSYDELTDNEYKIFNNDDLLRTGWDVFKRKLSYWWWKHVTYQKLKIKDWIFGRDNLDVPCDVGEGVDIPPEPACCESESENDVDSVHP